MKKEYDFSKGERGKFYRLEAELNIPVYLEPDIAKVVRERARKGDSSIGAVVNDWRRRGIRSGPQTRKLKVRYMEWRGPMRFLIPLLACRWYVPAFRAKLRRAGRVFMLSASARFKRLRETWK